MTSLRDLAFDRYMEAFNAWVDELTPETQEAFDAARALWREIIAEEEAQTRLPV